MLERQSKYKDLLLNINISKSPRVKVHIVKFNILLNTRELIYNALHYFHRCNKDKISSYGKPNVNKIFRLINIGVTNVRRNKILE